MARYAGNTAYPDAPALQNHPDYPATAYCDDVYAFAALGVVYGDIGTSPLYAIRECFHGEHAVALNEANILGVLSLMFWSLIIVITVKYLIIVMRADNHGEGGILGSEEAAALTEGH